MAAGIFSQKFNFVIKWAISAITAEKSYERLGSFICFFQGHMNKAYNLFQLQAYNLFWIQTHLSYKKSFHRYPFAYTEVKLVTSCTEYLK